MTPRLKKYELSLGERARRFALVPPPEPIHQPEPFNTARHKREGRQTAVLVVVIIAAMFALVEAAVVLSGAN